MKVGGEVSDMIKEDAEQHIKEHQEILIDENLEEEQLKLLTEEEKAEMRVHL